MNVNSATARIQSADCPRAGKRQFYWVCGLILSFAYERPIWHVTSMDRLSPRLFDVMVLVGIVMVLPRMSQRIPVPSPFRIWTAIVVVFCFCASVWTIGILPWEYGRYSLYFALVYLEGLIGIYMAISIPMDVRQKQIIHYLTVASGVFVAIYCIPQYLSGGATVQLASGESRTFGEGAFIGPLGYGYFHLAMFSGMSCVLALALIPQLKGEVRKVLMTASAVFVAWPAFFCGSRTGLLYTGVGVGALILLSRHIRRWTLPFVIVGGGDRQRCHARCARTRL